MSTDVAALGIDAPEVARYRTDGFLVVRRAFSPDTIVALDTEAMRLRQRTI
jgi:hypothetical protein